MTKMSDQELYQRCRKFGAMALSARQKFVGLLPEVFRRRLFEKKGYHSIYDFAAKLAGMSYEQVQDVLNLEKRYADKPALLAALVSGSVSVSKLRRVASIATVENEVNLCEKVKMFSNRAIEIFVRDVKREKANFGSDSGVGNGGIENQNGFQKPLFGGKNPHVQTGESGLKLGLKLSEDVEKELLEMQEKGIDINQFLREALKTRKEGIEKKKEEILEGEKQKEWKQGGRYIPVAIKRVIKEEYGTKCSYPGCMKEAQALHHTQRFALARVHDPHFIAPLCSAHHEIAHKIDVKYTEKAAIGRECESFVKY